MGTCNTFLFKYGKLNIIDIMYRVPFLPDFAIIQFDRGHFLAILRFDYQGSISQKILRAIVIVNMYQAQNALHENDYFMNVNKL